MQPAKKEGGCIEIELNCQSFKNALVQQAGVQQTFKARGLIWRPFGSDSTPAYQYGSPPGSLPYSYIYFLKQWAEGV